MNVKVYSMPGMTAIKRKAKNIVDGVHNGGHTLQIVHQISIFINNASNFHQPANQIIKSISHGLICSIYLILQPLQELSILKPFLQPITQDQSLTATPGRYAKKVVPTVTCSLQPSDLKLPTNHLIKKYLKPGKGNYPQNKY